LREPRHQYYAKQTYLYDTIVNGIAFNKIAADLHTEDDTIYAHIYTSFQNNLVLFNSDDIKLPIARDTLIYFGPIGSKWRCYPRGDESCQKYYVEITDTGTTVIQQQRLKWWKINYKNCYGNVNLPRANILIGVDTIFERIGYKKIPQQYKHCSDFILDQFSVMSFRCYNDNQLSVKSSTTACDYILSVNEATFNSQLVSIFPNPAQNHITIKNNNEEPMDIKIMDVLGNVLYEQNKLINTTSIDISHLVNGTYFILLSGKNYSVNKKLIVYKN